MSSEGEGTSRAGRHCGCPDSGLKTTGKRLISVGFPAGQQALDLSPLPSSLGVALFLGKQAWRSVGLQ